MSSHCNNSGCESGWTLYFEDSFQTDGRFRPSAVDYGGGMEEEEEEVEGDLSMISDASSGPRNGYYEENCPSLRRINGGKSVTAAKSKRKEEMGRRNQHSCLDDTASSPVFGLSKRETNPYTNEGLVDNVKEFSQSRSRKQQPKKQTSLFQSSSGKKMAKNVSGDLQEDKYEQ